MGLLQFPRLHSHRLSSSAVSGGQEPHIPKVMLHRKKPEPLVRPGKGKKILLGPAATLNAVDKEIVRDSSSDSTALRWH